MALFVISVADEIEAAAGFPSQPAEIASFASAPSAVLLHVISSAPLLALLHAAVTFMARIALAHVAVAALAHPAM